MYRRIQKKSIIHSYHLQSTFAITIVTILRKKKQPNNFSPNETLSKQFHLENYFPTESTSKDIISSLLFHSNEQLQSILDLDAMRIQFIETRKSFYLAKCRQNGRNLVVTRCRKKGRGEEGKNEKFTGFVPTSVSRWCRFTFHRKGGKPALQLFITRILGFMGSMMSPEIHEVESACN